MSSEKSSLDQLITSLKKERDALRLQMHLASMDVRDEYERLAEKIGTLSEQYEPVREAVQESAKGLVTALGLAAEEMKIGFERIRKSLNQQ